MLICILTKNVITSCSVTMMLSLHLEVKPLMTLTTVLYLSSALISGHLSFFFQAEDGIRDDLVTGVQTCALPIYSFSPHREARVPRRRMNVNLLERCCVKNLRSEERRVGKECRFGRMSLQLTKSR